MSNLHKSGAVLFAKDPQRVAAFYQALAGMPVTHSGKDIIVLESPGHQLLVFAVKSIVTARAAAPAYGGAT
jgi:catechol-2,3-dioxygenase